MKALIIPKHEFPHPTMDPNERAQRKPGLLEDLSATLRIADPYISGRAAMTSLGKVVDAFAPHVEVEERGTMMTILARPRDEDLVILLEDADFDVLKKCAKMVCEDGVNATTGQTQQHQRIFDSRRALRLLDFLDAVKEPDKKSDKKPDAAGA